MDNSNDAVDNVQAKAGAFASLEYEWAEQLIPDICRDSRTGSISWRLGNQCDKPSRLKRIGKKQEKPILQ